MLVILSVNEHFLHYSKSWQKNFKITNLKHQTPMTLWPFFLQKKCDFVSCIHGWCAKLNSILLFVVKTRLLESLNIQIVLFSRNSLKILLGFLGLKLFYQTRMMNSNKIIDKILRLTMAYHELRILKICVIWFKYLSISTIKSNKIRSKYMSIYINSQVLRKSIQIVEHFSNQVFQSLIQIFGHFNSQV